MPRPVVHLDTELPRTLAVGRGTCLFVSGSWEARGRRVSDPRLLIDGRAQTPVLTGIPVGGADRDSGFCGILVVSPVERPRRAALELEASIDGGARERQSLGEIELVPSLARPEGSPPPGSGNGPRVAICMASFDPDPGLLERQIASIREQTHGAWVCLISDDHSSEARFGDLRSLTAGDSRFVVSRSKQRLGFYRNFERALAMVPDEAAFVALADQDDRWYPEKLAELLARRGDARLIYSDMRVVDEGGVAISDTFWAGRRNNYTDLASLLLANTVTGAASLFRRDLLDLILPFPPQVGRAFHDQWIASVALATGRIAYVDRPLYDYVQHGSASLGHAAALRDYDPRRLLRWRDPRRTAREIVAHGRRTYLTNACRIALNARTLEIRAAGTISSEKARAVRRAAHLGRPPEPAAWLAVRSLRRLAGRNETTGIELSLLTAIAWRALAAARARAARIR
jgi:glycosyltransferase involved in cell wall biosynthesis